MGDWNATEAKNRFGDLLDEARSAPQVVQSRGRRVAVVLSFEEFERLTRAAETAKPKLGIREFLAFTEELKKKYGDFVFEPAPRSVETPRNPFAEKEE